MAPSGERVSPHSALRGISRLVRDLISKKFLESAYNTSPPPVSPAHPMDPALDRTSRSMISAPQFSSHPFKISESDVPVLDRFLDLLKPHLITAANKFLIRSSMGEKTTLSLCFLRSLKKALHSVGACAGGGGVMRGAAHLTICSASARGAYSYISKRHMSIPGGCGLGQKTAEELRIWQKNLEDETRKIQAEKMLLDTIRMILIDSWSNYCKIQPLLPSASAIRAVIQQNFDNYLNFFVVNGVGGVCFGALVMYTAQPGEAEQIPGNLMRSFEDKARDFFNMTPSKPAPALAPAPAPALAPPSSTSQVVFILVGSHSYPFGSISDLPIIDLPSTGLSLKEEGHDSSQKK